MRSDYQVLCSLSLKISSPKILILGLHEQGHSEKPSLKIRHNPRLIVETNTGPISSVSGWVTISKSVPGETYYSESARHKNHITANSDFGSYRICVWGYLNTCFQKLLGCSVHQQALYFLMATLLQTKVTLIKTWSQINNTALIASAKILFGGSQWETSNKMRRRSPEAVAPESRFLCQLGETGASRHDWDLSRQWWGCLLGLNSGDTSAGPTDTSLMFKTHIWPFSHDYIPWSSLLVLQGSFCSH